MTIPITHQRLFAQHDGKCSRCHREISLEAKDYRAAYVLYQSILCVYCRARASTRKAAGNRTVITYSTAPIDEQTIVLFCKAVFALCQENGVEVPSADYWPRYVSIPPAQIEQLAANLVNQAVGRSQRVPTNRRSRPSHKTKADKIALGHSQGDKCAYCGLPMHYDEHADLPEERISLATWEHIVNLNDDGDWSLSNLVIACQFCNWLRNEMKSSNAEFSVWIYNHRGEYDALRARYITRLKEKAPTKNR